MTPVKISLYDPHMNFLTGLSETYQIPTSTVKYIFQEIPVTMTEGDESAPPLVLKKPLTEEERKVSKNLKIKYFINHVLISLVGR